MISIYMIITILTTIVLAKGSGECVFSESAGICQCFEAVGRPLIFHLSNEPHTSITLIKDGKYRILKMENNGAVTINPEYVNQSEGINHGTFKLGNAMKKHTGNYTMEEHNSSGTLLRTINVNLKVQAPVSKPAVSQTCLSSEETQIICFSEGDEPEFCLTLDGQVLMQSRTHNQSLSNWKAEKSNSAVTINLHGHQNGNLMCQVWNKVSQEQTVIQLTACTGFVQNFPVLTAAVTASVVTVFLLLALALLIRMCNKKPRPSAVNDGNTEDEVIYTAVRVRKKTCA